MTAGADRVFQGWRHWLLALAITLAGLFLWNILLTPTEVTGHAPPVEYPRLSYRPVIVEGASDVMGDTLQAVWSPVLFSLPTHAGFSQDLLTHTDRMLPPAELPVDSFLLRSEPPSFLRETETMRMMDIKHHVQQRVRRQGEENAIADSVFEAGQHIENDVAGTFHFLGDLQREDLLEEPVAVPVSTNVVDGIFVLGISAAGFVNHVFVEGSSGDRMWDAAVVRQLKRWRIKGASQARQARILVRYGTYGKTTLAASAREEL